MSPESTPPFTESKKTTPLEPDVKYASIAPHASVRINDDP
jgi:hypothetical protein